MGLRVIPLGGLAIEQQRANQFSLVLAKLATQEVGHAEVGVELESLLNRLLGLLGLPRVVEKLRVIAPYRGLVRVRLGQLLDGRGGGFVLARAFELERLLDLWVIGGT